MAAFLEACADKLIADGLGTMPDFNTAPNGGVYVNRMPEDDSNGILLYNRLPASRIEPTIPQYLRTRFIVVCRGTDSLSTIQKAHLVSESLKLTDVVQSINGVTFIELYAEASPEVYPRSLGDFVEVGLTVRAAYISDGTYIPT